MGDSTFKILCKCIDKFPTIGFNTKIIPLEPLKACECNDKNKVISYILSVLRRNVALTIDLENARIDRYRLKIENKRLKAVLKSLGVNLNDILFTDRLIICSCQNNGNRFEQAKRGNKKHIKDLENNLQEFDSSENPRKTTHIIDDQLENINDVEILRDIGEDQRIEFTEDEKESSCAGVNRLRAKVRELEKNKKVVADQNHPVTIAQRPIETGTILSKTDDNSGIEKEAVHHPLIATKSSEEFTPELVGEEKKILRSSELITEELQEQESITRLENSPKELAKLQSNDLRLENDLQRSRKQNTVYEEELLSLSRQTDDTQGVESGKELIDTSKTMGQLSKKDSTSEQLHHQDPEQENIKLRHQLERLQKRAFELDAENLQLKNDFKDLREHNGNVEEKLNLLEALNGGEDSFKFKFEKCLEEVNKLKAEKLKLTNDFEDLQKLTETKKKPESPKVTSGDEELIQLRLDLENCQKEVHQLKNENSRLNDSHDNLTQQKEKLENKVNFSEKSTELSEDGLVEYDEIEHMRADGDEFDKGMNMKLNSSASLINELRRQSELSEKLNEEFEKLKKNYQDTEAENNNYLEALQNYEIKYKNLEDELVQRKRESSTLETERNKYLDEKDKLLEEWQKEKNTNDNLKKCSTTLGEQLEESREHEKSLQNELELTRKSLESTTINGETLKEKLENFMLNNKNLKESLIQKEQELNSVNDDINKMTLINKELEEKLIHAHTEKDSLQKMLDNIQKDCDQTKESSENILFECANLKKEKNELNSKINELQADFKDFYDRIKELNGKLDEEIKKAEGLTKDISDAEDQVKVMESKYSDRKNLKKQFENDLDEAKKEEENARNQLSLEKEANNAVQNELLILEKNLKDLIFQFDNMRINNDKLSEERDNLKEQLISKENHYEQQSVTMNSDSEILKKKIDDLEEELERCRLENSQMSQKIDELNSELKTELNKVDELENELLKHRDIENNLNDTEKKLTDITRVKDNALMEMNELHEELKLLKQALAKCRDQNEKLREELEDSKKQHSVLRKNSDDLKDEISVLKNAREKLQNDHNESLNKSLVFEDDLQKLTSQVVLLKIENNDLKAVSTNAEKNVEELKKANTNLMSDLEKAKADLNAGRISKEKLKNKLEELEKECSDSKVELDELKEVLQTSRINLSKEKSQVNTLESSLADLKTEKATLVEELNRLRIIIETLEKNLVSKENQLTATKADLVEFNALKDELNKCRQHRDELLSKSDTMKKQMETLKKDGRRVSDELNDVKPELNVLKTEKEELNSQIKTLEIELKDLKTESEKKKVLEREKEELEKRLMDSETTCNKLKKEIENLNKSKEKAAMKDATHEELDALTVTLASLRKGIEIRDIENDKLKTELIGAKSEVDKLKLESTETQNKNKNLDSQVKNLNNEVTRLNNEVNQLNNQKGQLENNIGKKLSEVEQIKEQLKSVSLERDILQSNTEKMQFDQDKLSSEFDEKEKRMSDVSKGVNKLMAETEKLETDSSNRLSRELDGSKKNSIDMEDKIQNAKVSEDLSNLRQELQQVKRQNNELKINLEKSKRDIDKCERENEELRSELREIMKSVSETKDVIQRPPGEPSRNENEETTELLQSEDLKTLQMEKESLQIKNNILENNLNDLKNSLTNYETENNILKSSIDETSKVSKLLSEIDSLRKKLKDLEEENTNLININHQHENNLNMKNTDIPAINSPHESLPKDFNLSDKSQFEDLKKCKDEIKRLQNELNTAKFENKILKSSEDDTLETNKLLDELNKWKKNSDKLEEEIKLLKSRINSVEDVVPIDRPYNDLIKTIDFLDLQMKGQTEGIYRIREKMGHLRNKVWHSSLESLRSDEETVFNLENPLLKNIFQQSKNLSTNVTSAEKELVDLGKVWKSCWEENQKLRKLVEDLGAANVLDTTKLPGKNIEGVFDPMSWLESLTFTELADLHDHICNKTSSFVADDDGPGALEESYEFSIPKRNDNDLQRNYNMLSKRIAALQRQIAEKQTDTGTKMIKLRRTLQRTQTEFMKISGLMNQKECRNSQLYRITEESPCWVNKCKAKCAEYIEFIPKVIYCKEK